jgi:uncharacterized RDD family membrane protein YckC
MMTSTHTSESVGWATSREEGAYHVLTPERVGLQYDIAGVGSRSAAALIDFGCQALAWLLLGLLTMSVRFAVGVVFGPGLAQDVANAVALALLVIGSFLVLWGYFLVFEIAWNGQTPGKRALGLRVIRENGYPIRPGDAVVRNLIRIVDGPPAMYFVGLLVMLLNARAKRPGDFAAGTVVVREGARRGLASLTVFEAPAAGPGPLLAAADATLVRDFLVRRGAMDAAPRSRLAARLAAALAQRYGLQAQRAGQPDEAFLEQLVGGAQPS